jgi:hypothetical protein
MSNPLFKGAFPAREDEEFSGRGVRPVIFDILGPDRETSILPVGISLVLHVNPSSLTLKYTRTIERIQTKGGFVEQHWGDNLTNIGIEASSGGFMRLYSGLSNITSPATTQGSRRETLAYDSYLDLLALFHNNGSVFDSKGQVALQGIVKLTFDGGVYLGWLDSFTVSEEADKPYQFSISTGMSIDTEIQVWRTAVAYNRVSDTPQPDQPAVAHPPLDPSLIPYDPNY